MMQCLPMAVSGKSGKVPVSPSYDFCKSDKAGCQPDRILENLMRSSVTPIRF